MSRLNKIFIAVICFLLIIICVLIARAAPDNVGLVNNCLVIGVGPDEDSEIVRVNVTGSPTISWDESEDSFVITHPLAITGIADGGLTNYDLKVGDTDETPTYGMMNIGDAVIGRTSFKNANMDADGTMVYRNLGGPITGKIEHMFTESAANTIRFALASSGVGNATYNSRSMLIAGPAVANTDIVTVGYWRNNNDIFHNIDCDTSGFGADLGVQYNAEIENDLFVDSIKESTPGAGVTFDSMIIPSGTTPAPDIAGSIFLDTDESANGSLMMYSNGAWRKMTDL